MRMARSVDNQFNISDQQFSCTDCGQCCRDWYVALLPEDKRRLAELNWQAADEISEKFMTTIKGDDYVAHNDDGTCIYFDRTARNCKIHARFGEAVKPLGCRVYPYNIEATFENNYSVLARFDCPAVREQHGHPINRDKRAIRKFTDALRLGPGFDRLDREGLAQGAIEKVVAALFKLVIGNKTIDCPTALITANVAVYRIEVLGADFLNDVNPNKILEPLLQRVVADVTAVPTTRRVKIFERWRFMALFAAFMRRDESLIGQGVGGRVRRTRALMRMILGTGNLRDLGEEHPDVAVTHADLFAAPIVNRKDVDWSLYLDMVKVRLQTYQFFGAANFNTGVYFGLQSLFLTFPLVVAAAKWHALERDLERCELLPEDIDYAVGAIDHAFGRAQVLNMKIYRTVSRQMVDVDAYRRLICSLLHAK
jgi:lysine-N-methylase